MRIAIVHDWIVNIGGAERVLKELARLWPDAPIYTLFADSAMVREHFPNADVRTSALRRVPDIKRFYRAFAPVMPSVIESLDFAGYDTVLSSSVMFSKGIIVRPGTRHICYCYSPSRILWDRTAAYERRGIFSRLTRHALRLWDYSASARPDQMVAISQTVAARISKYYRRDAVVVPPPVRMPIRQSELPFGQPVNDSGGFFLIVGRIVPHKNLDVALEAFAKIRYHLVVVGDGQLKRSLAVRAGNNVRFVGHVSDGELDDLYRACTAVIIPNEEDFGLTAVEAMAHGKPVLALRRGGQTETIIEGITGEFFDDPIPEAIADGVRRIKATLHDYNRAAIQTHATQWSSEKFAQRIQALLGLSGPL